MTKKRILIIDDEEGVRDAFMLALMAEPDLEVVPAASGQDGIAAAAAARPDLIFLDLNMPGLTGVDTMRELLAKDPELSIYIVTAFHREFMQELQQARAGGLSFELARKPLGADDIRLIVRSLLGGPDQDGAGERS